MEFQEYLAKKKKIYDSLLEFVNQNENTEENFQNLIHILNDQNLKKDKDELELFLHLIDNISKNHYRTKNFFTKIEKILLIFTNEYSNFFTNDEICNIFGTNKRILLFFVKNKIIRMDQSILQTVNKNYKKHQFLEYFVKEIKSAADTTTTATNENSDDNDDDDDTIDSDFEKNRENGENEELFCEMIRNDMISDFITYVHRNELTLTETIEPSVFETNLLLNAKPPTLIEYSAFFGSIQIFNYLFKNNVELTSSLWIYAIHGSNPEIIHVLEEHKINPINNSYKDLVIESIKCHHNEIANYIKTNFIENEFELNEAIIINSIKYNNYEFLYNDLNDPKYYFYYYCKYDYFYLVKQILKLNKIDVNMKIKDSLDNETLIFTPLLASIKNNCYNITSILLEQANIDVNIIGYRFIWPRAEITETALSLSIRNNNIQIVKLLLTIENLNVNEVLTDTRYLQNLQMEYAELYPIFLAVNSKFTQIAKVLLEHPNLDVNKKTIYKKYQLGPTKEIIQSLKRSILHSAIINNQLDIIKLLMNNPKIDINSILKMETGGKSIRETPLCAALVRKNEEISKLFLSHPNIDVNLPIVTITATKNEKFIKYPLYIAIKNKDINSVKLLLSNPKIDVNQISKFVFTLQKETNYSPLTIAIRNSDQKMVSLLLSNENIDVNMYTCNIIEGIKYKQNPLSFAIFIKEKEIVKLLLNHPNINANLKYIFDSSKQYYEERNNLILAIQNNDEEIVNILLNHPSFDVNTIDFYRAEDNRVKKAALLHAAILNDNINNNIITNLINRDNIDLNIKSYYKKKKANNIIEKELTTLYYAIKGKKFELIKLLLSKNSFDVSVKVIKTVMSPDTFYIEERTSLQMAVLSNNVEIFLCILNYLQKNNKITDNLNELMRIASDDKIKSYLYNSISK